MCRKALSSKADATPATAALSRERRRAHLIFKRSSVIPPTERSVQSREQTSAAKNCQIHSHTTGCVCLATTESLEQHVSSLQGGLWWIAQIWFGYVFVGNTTIDKLWCTTYVLVLCFFWKETLLISNKVTAIEITSLRPAIIARLADTSHRKKLLIAHLLKAFWSVWSYLTLKWPRWQFHKMNQWDFRAEQSATVRWLPDTISFYDYGQDRI